MQLSAYKSSKWALYGKWFINSLIPDKNPSKMNTNNSQSKVPQKKKKNLVDWYVEDALMPEREPSSFLEVCLNLAQSVLLGSDEPEPTDSEPKHARDAKQLDTVWLAQCVKMNELFRWRPIFPFSPPAPCQKGEVRNINAKEMI
jgi:hypothetical protein